MKTFIEKEEEYIKKKLKECGYESEEVVLNPSSRPEYGDYQYNGIMAIAKSNQENPREIAEKLVNLIKEDNHYQDINLAGPGFINITFSKEQLVDYINELDSNINNNYYNDNPKTIFLDYGGANVAKALHVGHLRSANIGEALKRLLQSFGYKTITDAHLGDWGRPIGLVMTEIKKRYPNLSYFQEPYIEKEEQFNLTNKDLMEIYPLASAKSKEDESYLEEARAITLKFQQREPGLIALWNKIMEVSKEDIKRIYKRLNTDFDLWEGESDGDKYIPELIETLDKLGIVEESEGAKVVNIKTATDDHEIPPLMLIKSNGSASYQTTDLACILERMKLYNPDEIWYVVDNRQGLHFEQVFRTARKGHIVSDKIVLEHIPFGTMNGADGKPFKTRDGGVMELETLLDNTKIECEKRILPNIIGDEREKIAEKVAVATIKYADLIPFRQTDYSFDPVKFSELQGKTGPYLLYSTIRMKSLLNKASEQNINYNTYTKIHDEIDRNIIIQTLSLRNVLEKSITTRSLHEITDYLYKITNLYNNFYSNNRVLDEPDNELKESWLILTKTIYENNLKLLNILGIEVPDKM